MGDWDRKSGYVVNLESEIRALQIKNRRLKALNDSFYDFVSSSPEMSLKWVSWLSDNHIRQEVGELGERIKQLEDLELEYLEMKE